MWSSLMELNWREAFCSLGFALTYIGVFMCALAKDYD